MAKKHPFNKILDRIFDIMDMIDTKGVKPAEDKITPEKTKEVQALYIIAKEYNNIADRLLKEQGATEEVIPKDDQLETLPAGEKKLFERIQEMKNELKVRQKIIKRVIERETEKPKKAAKAKKKQKKARLKKFRAIGGKKGWKKI